MSKSPENSERNDDFESLQPEDVFELMSAEEDACERAEVYDRFVEDSAQKRLESLNSGAVDSSEIDIAKALQVDRSILWSSELPSDKQKMRLLLRNINDKIWGLLRSKEAVEKVVKEFVDTHPEITAAYFGWTCPGEEKPTRPSILLYVEGYKNGQFAALEDAVKKLRTPVFNSHLRETRVFCPEHLNITRNSIEYVLLTGFDPEKYDWSDMFSQSPEVYRVICDKRAAVEDAAA